MGNVIYQKDNFIITKCGNSRHTYFTVVNNNKKFKGQHTHLNSYDEAVYILKCACRRKKPETDSFYLQESYKKLTILNYKCDTEKKSFRTIYADTYEKFCKKMCKYHNKYIDVIFLKCNTKNNYGFKAKIVKINKGNKYKYPKKIQWIYNPKNNTWI